MVLPSLRRFQWRHVGILALALMLSFGTSLPRDASALTTTGFDISYPQCDMSVPDGSFAILGVTGGRAFSTNRCLSDQYTKSVNAGLGSAIHFYMNLNAAIGSTASQGSTGPKGTCAGGDKACQAYNYGWKAARAAYATASQAGPGGIWFLDIETANSWNAKTALNIATIQGAVAYLECQETAANSCQRKPVGIYSTAGMWKSIAGSWQNGLPVWLAGTASTACPTTTGFTGGPVVFVQNASGASNGDRAC